MKDYKREYPLFSLCGLNCGLCPRYHTNGTSKCPGCGGKDFFLKHPSCAVITCCKKHGNIEYCFLCKNYPCDRYKTISEKDSFITYKNVNTDMQKALNCGIDCYKSELDEKIKFLEYLLSNFNDGKSKNFYCIAINLLNLDDLKEIKEYIDKNLNENLILQKEKIKIIETLFNEKAKSKNIDLKLRI